MSSSDRGLEPDGPPREAAPGLSPKSAVLADVRALLSPVAACAHDNAGRFARVCDAAAAAGRRPARADLEALGEHFRASLRSQATFVDGLGVVAAPGLLQDAEHWLEWWRRDRTQGIARLDVSFEEGRPGSYSDYDETEWYRMPKETGRAWISGPYVDQGGTNELICTYAVPVRSEEGARFVGVAAVDLLASAVERAAARALARLSCPAVVVNRDARILASNSAAASPGNLLRSPGSHQPVSDPDLGWSVLELQG